MLGSAIWMLALLSYKVQVSYVEAMSACDQRPMDCQRLFEMPNHISLTVVLEPSTSFSTSDQKVKNGFSIIIKQAPCAF